MFFPYPFQCDLCNKNFCEKEAVQNHLQDHIKYDVINNSHLYKCCLCDEYFPCRSEVRSHIEDHNMTRQHKCKICDQRFQYHKAWREHQESYHSEKERLTYICNKCNKVFISQNTLKYHEKTYHKGGRKRLILRYACDICGNKYNNSHSRDKHRKLVHFTPKTFKCKECGKMFKTNGELLTHQKQSTKHKKYVCNSGHLCRQIFINGTTRWSKVQSVYYRNIIVELCNTIITIINICKRQ